MLTAIRDIHTVGIRDPPKIHQTRLRSFRRVGNILKAVLTLSNGLISHTLTDDPGGPSVQLRTRLLRQQTKVHWRPEGLEKSNNSLRYTAPTCFICMRIVCFILELRSFEVPPTTRLAPSDWDHPASVLRTPGRIVVGYMHSSLDACFWRFRGHAPSTLCTLPRCFCPKHDFQNKQSCTVREDKIVGGEMELNLKPAVHK